MRCTYVHLESSRTSVIIVIKYKEFHIITIITTYVTVIRLWLNNNVCQHEITHFYCQTDSPCCSTDMESWMGAVRLVWNAHEVHPEEEED